MIFEPKSPYILVKKDTRSENEYEKKESGLLLPKNKKENQNTQCVVVSSSSSSKFMKKTIVLVKEFNENTEAIISNEGTDLHVIHEDHILGIFQIGKY